MSRFGPTKSKSVFLINIFMPSAMRRSIIILMLFACLGTLQAQSDTNRLRLILAGDIMGHSTLIESGRQSNGTYDFNPCFQYVKDYVQSADLAIANLEVTLAGKPYSSYPYFSSPDELAIAAKNAGFDILTTANNHCLDKGKHGLERTITALDSLGIPHLGTYVDAASHDMQNPLMVEKNGIRIALLCYTYGCNGFYPTRPNVVNFIDTNEMRRDIKRAHARNADFVITIIHWGIEYETHCNHEQANIAKWLMNNGSDIVIGGHPHVVQNMTADINPNNERYPEIVVYSMGNLISNQRDINTDGGIMIELELAKNNGHTTVQECSYMPYWVNRYTQNKRRYYRIVPAYDALDNPNAYKISKEAQRPLKTFVTNLEKRIADSTPKTIPQEKPFHWFTRRDFYKNGKPINQ